MHICVPIDCSYTKFITAVLTEFGPPENRSQILLYADADLKASSGTLNTLNEPAIIPHHTEHTSYTSEHTPTKRSYPSLPIFFPKVEWEPNLDSSSVLLNSVH